MRQVREGGLPCLGASQRPRRQDPYVGSRGMSPTVSKVALCGVCAQLGVGKVLDVSS